MVVDAGIPRFSRGENVNIIGHKTNGKRHSMPNDYLGALYPEGATNIDELLYFSHDMIEELLESK